VRAIPQAQAEAALATLRRIETLPDIQELTRQLSVARSFSRA
jgi:hypothetical protein